MLIKEIELSNFRIYHGSNTIQLETTKKQNLVVISGKNGYGKTTFLMSIVWCLYGKQMQEVDELYYKEIAEAGGYVKYISNSLNRLARSKGESQFHVSITLNKVSLPDFQCNEMKITRKYDIQNSSSDEVEILIDGKPNELTSDIGTELFIQDYILPKEIAKFFLFDAEKIVTLAEGTSNEERNREQRRQLSQAYSEVLGIKKYVDLKENIEEIQNNLRKNSATDEEQKRANQLEAEIKNGNIELKKIDRQLKDLDDTKIQKNKELQEIQEKLIREGQLITEEEYQEIKRHKEELEKTQKLASDNLKESYDLIPFAIAGEAGLDVLRQLEDEISYRNAKFNYENVDDKIYSIINSIDGERIKQQLVIDGRIQEFYHHQIKELVKKHFFQGTNQPEQDFEMLHDFSDTEYNEWKALLSQIKTSFKSHFKGLSKEYTNAKNELNAINSKIKKAETKKEDPMIAAYRKKRESLESDLLHAEQAMQSCFIRQGEIKNEQIQKNKVRDQLLSKIEVRDRDQEKFETTVRLIKELQVFIENFQAEKKKSLELHILDGLNKLMHKKNFVYKVSVDIIDGLIDIRLYNKRKEEIKKESLSKGEQQMYATALLRGLVEDSEIEFPVFIDSPMQKFDEEHSQNIINYFYPNVSDQVVIFPLLKKELLEIEYEKLKKNVAAAFLIINKSDDQSIFQTVEPNKLFAEYERIHS